MFGVVNIHVIETIEVENVFPRGKYKKYTEKHRFDVRKYGMAQLHLFESS